MRGPVTKPPLLNTPESEHSEGLKRETFLHHILGQALRVQSRFLHPVHDARGVPQQTRKLGIWYEFPV